jgi:ATP-binding cassette subfamily B multidrug efflux pump
VEHCDKIVVMKKGKIIEEGGYNELLKRGGYFYKLVNAIHED